LGKKHVQWPREAGCVSKLSINFFSSGDDGLIYEGTFRDNVLIDGDIRYKSGKLYEKIKLPANAKKKILGKRRKPTLTLK
jgi:hypothetical protein